MRNTDTLALGRALAGNLPLTDENDKDDLDDADFEAEETGDQD
jgi:hypothetical protein